MANVMITSAGRRNYLVQYFRRALDGAGSVIAVDASPFAPALFEADVAATVPGYDSPEYVPTLLELVRAHRVDLLVCVHDYDALVLAEHLEQFRREKCLALVPPPGVVGLAADKWRLAGFSRERAIAYPPTFTSARAAADAVTQGVVSGPFIVKPRLGSGSFGLASVDDAADLEAAVQTAVGALQRRFPAARDPAFHDVVVQRRLDGPEFGIDVVNDVDGDPVAVLAREKLGMRGGETDKAVTVVDPDLEKFGLRLGAELGHVGCLDCDVIVEDGVPHLIDANPRFGGGYPFVHEAGADLPRAFVTWAVGGVADPAWFTYRQGVVGMKCDRLVTAPQPSA